MAVQDTRSAPLIDSVHPAGADAELKQIFFVCLAVATAAPLIGLGFGLGFLAPSSERSPFLLAALAPIIAATGNGHVAATTYLYLDQGFWGLIRRNWARFTVWPVLAVAGMLAATYAGPATTGLSNLVFFIWLFYHYQRQNYGVIAFATQVKRRGPLPKLLSPMLDLSVAGGICVMCSHHELLGLPIFRAFGGIFFAASTATLAYLIASDRRLRSDLPVLFFSVLGWAFFLPTLLSNDLLVSFTSFAIAHGAQYLIFLFALSGTSRKRFVGPIILVATTTATWLVFSRLTLAPAGLAVYKGLTIGHFLIDAKVWRMRDALQRTLLRQRFSFLFN